MRACLLILLVACGPATNGEVATPPPPILPVPEVPAPSERIAVPPASPVVEAPARRCLPVVAAECGCVYSCGLGTEESPGRWRVAHEFWGTEPIKARVDRWCVDGQCTEAFFGEIVCSGICSPKPAEPGCQLIGDGCAVMAASVPARPSAPLQPIKDWPFSAWDRAEAITYNQVAYGPGIPLRVYDASNGWSARIAERKPVTHEQAAKAAEWVKATRGELEVSKCAFPRHAIVFYSGDTPVGTANVCFECGDILVWPDFEPLEAAGRAMKQKLAGYKQVFPRWERLFRDELGFSLAPPPRP